MYLKIYNPRTNRKVSINSKIGRQILYKYYYMAAMQIGGVADPPPLPPWPPTVFFSPEDREAASRLLDEALAIPIDEEATEQQDEIYVFNNKFPNEIEYLYGPVNLDYYKFNIGNETKKIFLMGDVHTAMSQEIPQNAITSDEFIVYLSQSCANLNKCVDFYLENPLSRHQGNPHMSGGMYVSENIPQAGMSSMHYIRDVFKDCSYQNYKNEPYARECIVQQHTPKAAGLKPENWGDRTTLPTDTKLNNLRVHNIDIRLDVDGHRPWNYHVVSNFLYKLDRDEFRDLLRYAVDNKYSSERLNDIPGLFRIRSPNAVDEMEKYMKIIELVRKKVQKEESKFIHNNIFERVASPLTSAEILQGIRDTIYESWIEASERDEGKYRDVDVLAALHDMYTLLRMFKNFDITDKKGERGPSRCINITQQNNIIVYAGTDHTDCYKRVFDWLSKTVLSNFEKYSIDKKRVFRGMVSKVLTFNKDGKFASYNALMKDFCGE